MLKHSHLHILSLVWLFGLFSTATPKNAGTSLPSSALPAYHIDDVGREGEEGAVVSSRSATSTDDVIQEEEWRGSLPPGLRNERGAPLHRISMDGGVVLYLLGSSHVSRESCDDAKLLMEHVRPDVLFVELCSHRVGLLLPPPSSESGEQLERNNNHEMTPLSHRGNLMFAKIQADYAKKLNVTIGGEFRQAFQSALTQQRQFWESRQQNSLSGTHNPYLEARHSTPSYPINDRNSGSVAHPRGIRPCAIILGDRPVRITLLRAWESLRFFGKLKLMVALLWSSIKKPSEKELREFMESILNDRSGGNDLLTKSLEELGKAFPTLKRVIIEERDSFMVAKLRQTAEALRLSSGDDGEKVIVAVVGAGHCPGMLEQIVQKDVMCDKDEPASIGTPLERRPEKILPGIVETKKRKINDAEIASLVHDLVQFDYSYILQSEIQ